MADKKNPPVKAGKTGMVSMARKTGGTSCYWDYSRYAADGSAAALNTRDTL